MENDLILGVLFLLIGVIYLYSLFKRRSLKEGNSWDKSMFFRGIVGGVCLILIGVVSLLIYLDIW
jgi:uncharacterized membrane protein HdeD (DUF308 family)